jgi:hypothetical protein
MPTDWCFSMWLNISVVMEFIDHPLPRIKSVLLRLLSKTDEVKMFAGVSWLEREKLTVAVASRRAFFFQS